MYILWLWFIYFAQHLLAPQTRAVPERRATACLGHVSRARLKLTRKLEIENWYRLEFKI